MRCRHRRRAGRPAAAGDRARSSGRGHCPERAGQRDRAGAAPRRAGHARACACPEVLDAIRRAIASGAPQRVEFIERVPVERWHEAIVAPIAFPSAPAGAGRPDGAGHVRRSHAAATGRGDARRFRRQCQPRAAHAARRAVRLHRDPARLRARRSGGADAVSRDHAGAGDPHGAADRRSACRCRASSSTRICGPTSRWSCAASSARWSTGCRRWRATARWTSA